MNKIFEYAVMEWLWDAAHITTYLSDNKVLKISGSYPEVVIELNKLGQEGWEISSCTSGGNWIFWTFKREVGPAQGNRP